MSEWSIRRSLEVDAPASVVWACISSAERVSTWWCPPPSVEIEFEAREGGRYVERYDDGEHRYEVDGTVSAFEPPRRLAIRRLTEGSAAPADKVDVVLVEQDGRTVVTIDHSFEELSEDRQQDMEEFFAAGWEESLRRLRQAAVQRAAREP